MIENINNIVDKSNWLIDQWYNGNSMNLKNLI